MDGFSISAAAKLADTASTISILLLLLISLIREWIVIGKTARRENAREKEISSDYKQAWQVSQASSEVTQEQFKAIMYALETHFARHESMLRSLEIHFREDHPKDKRESV